MQLCNCSGLHSRICLFMSTPQLPAITAPLCVRTKIALCNLINSNLPFQIPLQPAAALHCVRLPGLSSGADRAHGHPTVRHGALQRRPRLCHDGALATVRVPGKCSRIGKTLLRKFFCREDVVKQSVHP